VKKWDANNIDNKTNFLQSAVVTAKPFDKCRMRVAMHES
jgi:hypothetical protein